MSPIDKYSVNYVGDDLERMTDFTEGRLATDFRLVSFVYGEDYVITIAGGKQEEAWCPHGKTTVTLDDALVILREDKNYIVTDVSYIFEEHMRYPYYNFQVAFDKNLVVSINGVTGEKQEIWFGKKGVW